MILPAVVENTKIQNKSRSTAMIYLIDSGRAMYAHLPVSLRGSVLSDPSEFKKYSDFIVSIAINKAKLFENIRK